MKGKYNNLIFLLAALVSFAVFLPSGELFSFFQSNKEANAFSIYLPVVVRYPPDADWVPLGFSGEKVTDLYLDPDLAGHVYASVFLWAYLKLMMGAIPGQHSLL